MKRRKSVLIAFGTRPEAVKMAPVLNALEADKAFEVEALSTAQHREMLDQTAAAFDLRIDHDLNLMRDRQTLDGLTARILTSATPVLELAAPDAVLVHGDTTTALALALASFYRQIPWGTWRRACDRETGTPLSRGDEPSSYLKPLHLALRPHRRQPSKPPRARRRSG